MQGFQFRLARVLRFRESQAKSEEAKLEALRQIGRRYEIELAALSEKLNESHRTAKAPASIDSFTLAALDGFERRVKREREEWQRKIRAQTEEIKKQEAVVVEARRKVELLNKLREGQRSQWEEAEARELDATVADFSAAEWNRRQLN